MESVAVAEATVVTVPVPMEVTILMVPRQHYVFFVGFFMMLSVPRLYTALNSLMTDDWKESGSKWSWPEVLFCDFACRD
jgi:hypothetical protein